MCGIAGFIGESQSHHPSEILKRMSSVLAHRGPDSFNTYIDIDKNIALLHRRLAIIDLSEEGSQPMVSTSGRYTIIFNGEIYNYLELKQELKDTGHTFYGKSDTEVILAAFEEWGIHRSVEKFNGMFAIGLLDGRENKFFLLRDRIGIKPLYLSQKNGVFIFASELKAIICHPTFTNNTIDRDVLALFLRQGYIPSPHCIFEGIQKLLPGYILEYDIINKVQNMKPFWELGAQITSSLQEPFAVTDTSRILVELEALLKNSIAKRMLADVPLGAFLSGGIDSSLVTALMQQQSDKKIKTFSIGFKEAKYDESPFAQQVANHLGTEHTMLYVTSQDALNLVPHLPEIYDEPFGDSSQIPTYLLSKLTREHVTVALSGDGGDELFTGYSRYFITQQIWKRLRWLPTDLRYALYNLLTLLPLEAIRKQPYLAKTLVGRYMSQENMARLKEILRVRSELELYHLLISTHISPDKVVLRSSLPPTIFDNYKGALQGLDFMTSSDAIQYIPGDILTKVDRASMAVSLEARVPLLDHRILEFAWKIPQSLKTHNGQAKWILKQILYKYVPQDLINRPKQGFSVPIANWLRGALRDWAGDLLQSSHLEEQGYFDIKQINTIWKEHQNKDRNWQAFLWNVLMFQAWHEKYKRY